MSAGQRRHAPLSHTPNEEVHPLVWDGSLEGLWGKGGGREEGGGNHARITHQCGGTPDGSHAKPCVPMMQCVPTLTVKMLATVVDLHNGQCLSGRLGVAAKTFSGYLQ